MEQARATQRRILSPPSDEKQLTDDIIALATRYGRYGYRRIHHSDRGTQYACNEYRRLLQNYGMVSSMSRSGNCLDNAVAERFFRTLNSECLVNWRYMPAEEVKHDIVDYIEMFYNSERLYSYAGYLCPDDYEKLAVTLV
jgi:putative transposase